MIIAIVSEIDQDEYWLQWRWVWSDEMQEKLGCVVKSIIINPSVLSCYTKESPYWDWLKKADLVFVYCTRTEIPEGIIFKDIYGRDYHWNWWQLPKYVKLMMKPEAKMIVQWDDEWVWLFHPDWVWWFFDPDTRGGPDQLFSYGIMDCIDMIWTNLEKPEYAKYAKCPIRYMPIPSLTDEYLKYYVGPAEEKRKKFEPYDMHEKNIAVLRHTSRVASVEHTIHNVIEETGLPLLYFSTSWTNPDLSREIAENIKNGVYKIPVSQLLGNSVAMMSKNIEDEIKNRCYTIPVKHVLYAEPLEYIKQLLNEGFIAVDDAEKYIGWSRFSMECAINYIPSVGSTMSSKMFFPELHTEPKDYARQIELVNQLVNDKEFYNRMANEGHRRMLEHLNAERLCREMVKYARELKVPEMPFDLNAVKTKEKYPKLKWEY